MKDYIEELLHREVSITDYNGSGRLPPVYRDAVRLHILGIDGQEFLLAEPVGAMALTDLRKLRMQAERLTGIRCALYLRALTCYAKDALLREGIPFVWEKHQMYLPFLGIMLNPAEDRRLKPAAQISFITQKLLLTALYEAWNGVTVSRAAEALGVSKMTVTRCFDELEALDMPVLRVKSRARRLFMGSDRLSMWQLIRPVLRNPIIREFHPAEALKAGLPKSGISALAEYSMLADNPFPTVAFERARAGELNAAAWKQVPRGEQPACVVHEVGYMLPFGKHNTVDPLSITLMLSDEEKSDPRVEECINEMLEEYVW